MMRIRIGARLAGVAAMAVLAGIPAAAGDVVSQGWLGVVFTRESVDLVAETDAEVRRVEARLGEEVRAGEAVLRLESPELGSRLRQAQALLAAAEAQVLQARAAQADADRRLQMRESAPGMFSREEVESARSASIRARAESSTAEAHVREQEAAVEELQRETGSLRVEAPFDGVVAACWCEAGRRVARGQRLARLVSAGRSWVRFAIPSEGVAALREGLELRVIAGSGVDSCRAVVRHLGPEVDSAIDMVFAEASLDSSSSGLRIGDVVRVRPLADPTPRPPGTPRKPWKR